MQSGDFSWRPLMSFSKTDPSQLDLDKRRTGGSIEGVTNAPLALGFSNIWLLGVPKQARAVNLGGFSWRPFMSFSSGL